MLKRALQKAARGFNRIAGITDRDWYSKYFNTGVKIKDGDWAMNERVVEIPFVHKALPLDSTGKRVMELGCTRSELCLQLASLGFEVQGVDLRPYSFTHSNLNFVQKNVLEFEGEPFDFIVTVSVLEHVGLGHYKEMKDESALTQVIDKLADLLVDGGRLVVTVPCGAAFVDDYLRSFLPSEIKSLFNRGTLNLITEEYYCKEGKYWKPCSAEEITSVHNAPEDCGPTGVNGVGCLVAEKRA